MNLQSPHRHLLPRQDYLPPSDPLVKADQLAVNIEAKEALTDGLIDEIITITIDEPCCGVGALHPAWFINGDGDDFIN